MTRLARKVFTYPGYDNRGERGGGIGAERWRFAVVGDDAALSLTVDSRIFPESVRDFWRGATADQPPDLHATAYAILTGVGWSDWVAEIIGHDAYRLLQQITVEEVIERLKDLPLCPAGRRGEPIEGVGLSLHTTWAHGDTLEEWEAALLRKQPEECDLLSAGKCFPTDYVGVAARDFTIEHLPRWLSDPYEAPDTFWDALTTRYAESVEKARRDRFDIDPLFCGAVEAARTALASWERRRACTTQV